MKIVVLYTRLTGYWMACMEHDFKQNGNEYLVVRKTPSSEAPFQLESVKGITITDGDAMSLTDLLKMVSDFNPDILYVSGWADKRFLKIALKYKKLGFPVISGMDNQWLGTLRQHFATILSKFLVRKYFTHIWVPGQQQYFFARKLGFLDKNILTGLYCADQNIFGQIQQTKLKKQLLFIGRLVEHKGLKVLFDVLEELIKENKLEFEIVFVGNGPLESSIPKHDKIKNIPFVNPENLPQLMQDAGYFILPSLYEAWGVVIHESVLAGLPIITTNQCGAASNFVINNFNGFVYEANEKSQLKQIITKINTIDEKEYFNMVKNSKMIASKINLDEWSATINSVN